MTPPDAYHAGRAAYAPATPAHCPFGAKRLAQAWAAGWHDEETTAATLAALAQQDDDHDQKEREMIHAEQAHLWTIWNDDPT